MPTWLFFVLIILVFSLVAAWIVRRLLDVEVGWLRSFLTALVVFLVASPIALWTLREAEIR